MKLVTGLLACAAVGLAGAASGRPEIQYNTLAASATTINFDAMAGAPSLGTGEVLAGQYVGQGVTFSTPNWDAYATNGVLATASTLQSDPNVIWVNQGGGGGGGTAVGINVDFSGEVHRVGVWFGGSSGSTFRLGAYNGNTLLETVAHGLPSGGVGVEGHMAIERSEAITRLVLTAANPAGANWNFAFDDLKFEVDAGCYPDCNEDGALTVADFGCFQTRFVAGDPYADCNQSGSLTVADFGCFQTAFVGGCP